MKKLNEQFIELLRLTDNIENKKASVLLGVSTRTIKRYKKGLTRPPLVVIRLLTILAGDISQINNDFAGWTIRKNELISPNNEHFSRSRLEHYRTEMSINRDNRADIKGYQEEIKKLKDMLPKAEVFQIKKATNLIEN